MRHLDEVARIGMQQAEALVNSVRGEAGAASGTKPAPVDFEKVAAEYVRIAKVVQDAIAASVRIAKGARTPKVSEAVLAERRRRMH